MSEALPAPLPLAHPLERMSRFSLGGTMGRYLLGLIARPFSATLLVLLPALLMERLLRLFDLVANQNVPAAAVMRMLVDLVPHYLGLALPASLFVGVYFVIARLSTLHELEAMQNAGCSLGWISRPFFALALVVAIGGIGLYGYVQPYARYAYRAAFQAATQGTWDATIPRGEIVHVSKRLVVTADASDRSSGKLGGVVIWQRAADGTEKITTARTGKLGLSGAGDQLLLSLKQVAQVTIGLDERAEVLTAPSAELVHSYVVHLTGFRPRGIDEREMTLGEIWRDRQSATPTLPRRQLDGELHSRLVRSLSLALLPLLAVPFGLAAQRSKRQYGIVVGVVILVLYYHAIQLAQSFGSAGFIDPRGPLWLAFLAFLALGAVVFRRATRHTSEGPLDGVFAAIEDGVAMGLRTWRTLRARIA